MSYVLLSVSGPQDIPTVSSFPSASPISHRLDFKMSTHQDVPPPGTARSFAGASASEKLPRPVGSIESSVESRLILSGACPAGQYVQRKSNSILEIVSLRSRYSGHRGCRLEDQSTSPWVSISLNSYLLRPTILLVPLLRVYQLPNERHRLCSILQETAEGHAIHVGFLLIAWADHAEFSKTQGVCGSTP